MHGALRISESELEVVSEAESKRLPVSTDPLLRQAREFLQVVGGGPAVRLADFGEGLRSHELAVAVAAGRPSDTGPA